MGQVRPSMIDGLVQYPSIAIVSLADLDLRASLGKEEICRAFNINYFMIEYVGIDQSGFHIVMSKQPLVHVDSVSALKQLDGK
jgi:hypothetical protein